MTPLARQNIEVFADYLSQIEEGRKGEARDHREIAERLLTENIFLEEPVLVNLWEMRPIL